MKQRSTNRQDLIKIAIILGLMYVYRKQLFSATTQIADEMEMEIDA